MLPPSLMVFFYVTLADEEAFLKIIHFVADAEVTAKESVGNTLVTTVSLTTAFLQFDNRLKIYDLSYVLD